MSTRKIIHVDMDCFYAAIEMRDNPALQNKPVAVGGTPAERGVICTCNYAARKYGVHSAMASAAALRQCPDLILLPVDMPKYRAVARRIKQIFHEVTDLVEPLSLDEAYLDVTGIPLHQGSATLMATAIREKIWQTEQLTASAGVAPNKLLAKIASGWQKPNGLFVIKPDDIAAFMPALPVAELFGVGKVTAQKLHAQGIQTCADLQKISQTKLVLDWGKFGQQLYDQCRGIDERPVESDHVRKSLSVERTFAHDAANLNDCFDIVYHLYEKLLRRVQESAADLPIKSQFVKIKFSNFKQVTAEAACQKIQLEQYQQLLQTLYQSHNKAIRLLGLGVHFHTPDDSAAIQTSLF